MTPKRSDERFEREAARIVKHLKIDGVKYAIPVIADALMEIVLEQYEGEDSPVAKISQAAYSDGYEKAKSERQGHCIQCETVLLERHKMQKERDASYFEGFARGREEAAKVAQTFKWADDDDSEVTELIAHRIRALKPAKGERE